MTTPNKMPAEMVTSQAETPDIADLVAAQRPSELRDPDADMSPFGRGINRFAEFVGVVILSVVVLLVFSNAVSRYAFGTAIIWSDEVVIDLMPWLGMIGLFLSIRRREVIRIGHFIEGLPSRVKSSIELFVTVLSAAVFTYLAIVSFNYVSMFGGDRSVYLDLPAYWFTSALVIGAAGSAIAYLVDLIPGLRAKSSSGQK